MVEKKKADVPDDSKAPKLEMFEYVGLVFAFLWFHRGIVLAILALVGLRHFLTLADDRVSKNKQRDTEAPAFVYIPRPVKNASGTEIDSFKRSVSLPAVRRPSKKSNAPKLDSKTIRFQKFIVAADVDSLVRRFTNLMQEVPKATPLEAVSNLRKCQKICDRMYEKELAPDQLEQLVCMELEAISQLDATNTEYEMEIPGLRNRLMTLAASLHRHPAVEVSAKAHLAIFAAHAMDLMFAPTQEALTIANDMYDTHVEGVLRGGITALVMAEILQGIVQRHQFDEVISLRRDLGNRMLKADSINLDELNVAYKERIIFGDLGLSTLVARSDGVSQVASRDVQLFYQRLERFPETRKQIYQFALDIIDKHVTNEQFDQASILLNTLQRIQPSIPDAETRNWFGESLLQYEEKIRLAQVAH